MKISNYEIAKMVYREYTKNCKDEYSIRKIMEMIDECRTDEQEQQEIIVDTVLDIVENVLMAIEIDKEQNQDRR